MFFLRSHPLHTYLKLVLALWDLSQKLCCWSKFRIFSFEFKNIILFETTQWKIKYSLYISRNIKSILLIALIIYHYYIFLQILQISFITGFIISNILYCARLYITLTIINCKYNHWNVKDNNYFLRFKIEILFKISRIIIQISLYQSANR